MQKHSKKIQKVSEDNQKRKNVTQINSRGVNCHTVEVVSFIIDGRTLERHKNSMCTSILCESKKASRAARLNDEITKKKYSEFIIIHQKKKLYFLWYSKRE